MNSDFSPSALVTTAVVPNALTYGKSVFQWPHSAEPTSHMWFHA